MLCCSRDMQNVALLFHHVTDMLEHLYCALCAGEELRVLVVGYIRPEANFESLDALIKRIHVDGKVTRECLSSARLAPLRDHPFLKPMAGGDSAKN